jgi:hypothetical protein
VGAARSAGRRGVTEKPPPLDSELVRQFVVAGHGDLAAVREQLALEPALLDAAWDWGGGDWETALGGAAHMGHRPIAEFLLEQGARLDVFAGAMLGRVEVVSAILEAEPAARHALGPHGISLLQHAEAGGAADVVELLS